MKLYMFYVGGNAGQSNIEVHDIQFVAADAPQEAWPALRAAWFGDKDKIHIDGYSEVTWVDGFTVALAAKPVPTDQHLFFVNVGGYRADTLAELHEFGLFVASSAAEAKQKALQVLLCGADQQHKDNLKDVDDCLLLDKVGALFVTLTPCAQGERDKPLWQGYQPIGEKV